MGKVIRIVFSLDVLQPGVVIAVRGFDSGLPPIAS